MPGLLLALALSSVVAGDERAAGDEPAILLSRPLATARHLSVGDTVRIAARPSGEDAVTFRVAGIYEPEPDPMRFAQPRLEARLHLPDLLTLTGASADAAARDTIGSINIALADPGRAPVVARDLGARLPGVVARPVSAPDERTSTFIVIDRFHLAIAIVTISGSAVFLLALMVMLVDERRETVGMLRLIGFTRRRLLLQIVVEGALIAGAGTLFGIAFAAGAEGLFNRFFQWRYDTALVFVRITPSIMAQSALFALPLGIVASLVASWTLLRRRLLALVGR